jgi:RNA polymerase sigma factor (sigma-70 family)
VPTGLETADARFEAFYRQEFTAAARLAWLLTRTSAVADDLAQDAFIALRASFDSVVSPRSFVNGAIVNRARTWHRDERRHRLKLVEVGGNDLGLDPADADLFDVVGKLAYRQRVVIVARYWGGWSEAEIADALGCRPGTVKSLASRALRQLRREVEP